MFGKVSFAIYVLCTGITGTLIQHKRIEGINFDFTSLSPLAFCFGLLAAVSALSWMLNTAMDP